MSPQAQDIALEYVQKWTRGNVAPEEARRVLGEEE